MTEPSFRACRTCGVAHGPDGVCVASRDGRIGAIIAERYRIAGLLGRGGMGSVYEARHVALDRRFAIKFLLPEYATNSDILRRFENEAKAAGQLEHMNIAAVTDFGRAPDGAPYLVMEYLDGQDCSALLGKVGALPVARATNITYQACLGLFVAHQAGIIHRDIKPENLFILRSGEGDDWVKILDFGIAKLRKLDASAVTATGVTMGTIFYMSPEQIRDSARVDERTDIWALGVVLYELLTGKRPFGGRDIGEAICQIVQVEPERVDKLRPGLPQPLAMAIHRALEKEPDKRFPSVEAFGEAIRVFTNRPSVPAPRSDLALVDTVSASAVNLRRQASTSQVVATALPARASASRQWRLPAMGLVVVVFAVWVIRSLVSQTQVRRSADNTSRTDLPSVGAASPESVLPAPGVSAAPRASLAQPSANLERTAGEDGQNSSSVPPTGPFRRVVKPAPSLQAAGITAPAETPQKKPQGQTTVVGVPITIDSRNPF